jgi:hypothetical protein
VKATCGLTPPATEGQPKPQIGEPRSHLVDKADWKAHHRDTNRMLGLFWDFLDTLPTIVGVFYSNKLFPEDWRKIQLPKEAQEVLGEGAEEAKPVGRTTSVSPMKAKGVKKMGKGWVILPDDPILIKGMGQKNVFDLGPNDVTPFTSHTPPAMLTALTELEADKQQTRRRKKPAAPRQTRSRKKKGGSPPQE